MARESLEINAIRLTNPSGAIDAPRICFGSHINNLRKGLRRYAQTFTPFAILLAQIRKVFKSVVSSAPYIIRNTRVRIFMYKYSCIILGIYERKKHHTLGSAQHRYNVTGRSVQSSRPFTLQNSLKRKSIHPQKQKKREIDIYIYRNTHIDVEPAVVFLADIGNFLYGIECTDDSGAGRSVHEERDVALGLAL